MRRRSADPSENDNGRTPYTSGSLQVYFRPQMSPGLLLSGGTRDPIFLRHIRNELGPPLPPPILSSDMTDMSPLCRYEPPRQTSRTDIFELSQFLGEIFNNTSNLCRKKRRRDERLTVPIFVLCIGVRSGVVCSLMCTVFSAIFVHYVNGLSVRVYTRGVLFWTSVRALRMDE